MDRKRSERWRKETWFSFFIDPSTQHVHCTYNRNDRKTLKKETLFLDWIEGVILKQFNKWTNWTHTQAPYQLRIHNNNWKLFAKYATNHIAFSISNQTNGIYIDGMVSYVFKWFINVYYSNCVQHFECWMG